MVEQGVHQRVALGAGGGVDGHARGFVEDDDVVVLVDDVEGDAARREVERNNFWHRERKHFAGFHFVRAVGVGGAVAGDGAFLDEFLQPRAGNFRQRQAQEFVEAGACGIFIDGDGVGT